MKVAAVLIAGAFAFANSAARSDEASTNVAPLSGTRLVCGASNTFEVETAAVVVSSPDDDVGPPVEPGPESDIQALLAGRTADCTAGGRHIRARTSSFEEQWGGWRSRDPAMFVRLWVDGRPLSVVLRVEWERRLSARVDLARNLLKVCSTSLAQGDAEKRPCLEAPFTLGVIDPIEFAPKSAFPGPHHDIFITEGQDKNLCRAFAAYFEGGPLPARLTTPESVPSPDALKAWGEKSYRLDADNDGEIDDVAVMDIEQYLIHGTVVAVFERDSVLTGRVPSPWWGDLMTIAMGNNRDGRIKPPPALKAAVWGGSLGLSGNTLIRLHVVAGETYAQITPRWLYSYRPMMEDDRKAMPPIEPARLDTRYTELVVRTLPGMKPEPVCAFTRRSQIFE